MLKILVGKGGVIDKDQIASFVDRADPDCPRCHGKAIARIEKKGCVAVICKCVEGILRAEAQEKLTREPLPPIEVNPAPEATQ